jgi:hypothetical protein
MDLRVRGGGVSTRERTEVCSSLNFEEFCQNCELGFSIGSLDKFVLVGSGYGNGYSAVIPYDTHSVVTLKASGIALDFGNYSAASIPYFSNVVTLHRDFAARVWHLVASSPALYD